MEPKICPIMQLQSDDQSLCVGERCALCIRGRCALVDISNSLAEIAMDVAALDQGGN